MLDRDAGVGRRGSAGSRESSLGDEVDNLVSAGDVADEACEGDEVCIVGERVVVDGVGDGRLVVGEVFIGEAVDVSRVVEFDLAECAGGGGQEAGTS